MAVVAMGRHRLTMDQVVKSIAPVGHNLGLITAGCIVYVIGMHSVMIPAGLFSGGLTGMVMLAAYRWPGLDIGLGYMLLNLPFILLGWHSISRQFMLYTLFGTLFFSIAASLVTPAPLGVDDPILAALLAGIICGAGCGLILRSMGSAGGMDILAVYLNRRFAFRVGMTGFTANALVIMAGAWLHDVDMALYSLIFLFTCGRVTDQVVSGFNARKAVMIVTEQPDAIARTILRSMGRGVTFLDGQGAYSGRPKKVLLTVTTMTDLPKLKTVVFSADPDAFVVINETMEVLGKRGLERFPRTAADPDHLRQEVSGQPVSVRQEQ